MSPPPLAGEPTATAYQRQLEQGFRRLRFEPTLEREYRADLGRGPAHLSALAALVALCVWVAFIGIDLLRLDLIARYPRWPDPLWQLVLVRGLVLLILAGAWWRLTRLPALVWPARRALVAGALLGVALGSAAAIAVYLKLQVPHESAVLMLAVLSCFLPLGLFFGEAVALALVVTVGSTLIGLLMLESEGRAAFIRLSFSLLVTAAVGAIGAYLREHAQREQYLLRRELEWLAARDPLTGLLNRRQFNLHLDTLIRLARREGREVALVLLDVDHFKLYNDACGHLAGDRALQALAERLQAAAARPLDLAARTGGEEMALLLFDPQPEHLLEVCDRLLDGVWSLALPHPASLSADRVTVSLGYAVLGAAESAVDLYHRADAWLYEAKAQGRNCARGPLDGRRSEPAVTEPALA